MRLYASDLSGIDKYIKDGTSLRYSEGFLIPIGECTFSSKRRGKERYNITDSVADINEGCMDLYYRDLGYALELLQELPQCFYLSWKDDFYYISSQEKGTDKYSFPYKRLDFFNRLNRYGFIQKGSDILIKKCIDRQDKLSTLYKALYDMVSCNVCLDIFPSIAGKDSLEVCDLCTTEIPVGNFPEVDLDSHLGNSGIVREKLSGGIYQIDRGSIQQGKNLDTLLSVMEDYGFPYCSLRWSPYRKTWILSNNAINSYNKRCVYASFDKCLDSGKCTVSEVY